MYAVSARRTMANAKPKITYQEKGTVSVKRAAIEEAWRRSVENFKRQQAEVEEAKARRMREAVSAANEELAIVEAKLKCRRDAVMYGRYVRHPGKIQDVVSRICRVFGVSFLDIKSASRTRRLVLARQAIMYWCERRTMISRPALGRALGCRDHTTVLHGSKSYAKKRASMGRHLRPARLQQGREG